MRRETWLSLLLALLLAACGGDSPAQTPAEISFQPRNDTNTPAETVQQTDAIEDLLPEVGSDLPPVDVPVTQTGCGDGKCQGAETPENCAKDCLTEPPVSAFVFAHKGDELGALGRIYDLTEAGAEVYVFYLTHDDTPLAEVYDDSPAKLAVASLGIPAANVYTYEKHVEWDIVTGNHEVLDRLTQHFITVKPQAIYIPQLCGGELENELAHAVGIWAAKRAKIFPEYYELPVPSNYYVGSAPDPANAQADPDAFVNQFIKRWKLIPKETEELKPTLGGQDMAQIRLAAAHVMNTWFQNFLYSLPEDKLLYLLREIQRYRVMPQGQKTDKKPFLESLDNPGATFIYEDQGYTFDEYKQRAAVVASFYGTNIRTVPSALPWFDEPVNTNIGQPFDIVLDMRVFSPDPDTLSFKIGFGPSKNIDPDYSHCTAPEPVDVQPQQSLQITAQCTAEQPAGQHVYYVRAYSKLAEEENDAAWFTEVPYQVQIANF